MSKKFVLVIVSVLLAISILNCHLSYAQDSANSKPVDVKLIDDCLNRAIELHKKGKYKKAQKEFYFYEDNVKKYDSHYYHYKAFNDFYLKIYDSSKEYFLENYEKDTSNYELLYYLGVSYLLDSHSFEGALYLSKYISHFPQNDMAYYYLAEALYNEHQYKKSYRCYIKSAELGNKQAKKKLRRKFNDKLLDNSNDDYYEPLNI